MADTLTADQRAFLEWTLLTDRQRLSMQLPRTEADWAASRGVSERTVRRWKQAPGFASELADRKAGLELVTGPPAQAPVAGVLDPAAAGLVPANRPASLEDQVALATQLLVDRIGEGDLKAVDPFLRMPHVKAYLEAQTAALTATFEDLSDEALAGRLLETFTAEELAAELESRGWDCEETGP